MSASDKKKLRKEQEAAALTEKQLNQKKQDKKLRGYTVTFAVVMILVFAIAVGSIGVSAFQNTGIPARSTVALTIGDYEMSNAELNYYFIDTVNNFYNQMYQQYSEYTVFYLQYLYNVDMTKPLDTQVYDEETGKTWAEYFLDQAITSATNTYALYNDAVANGYTGGEDFEKQISSALSTTEAMAGYYGFKSMEDYLRGMYGPSANVESFTQYYRASALADAYYTDSYENQDITAEMISKHNAEHYNDFSTFSYSYYYLAVEDYHNLIESGKITPDAAADVPAEAAEESTDKADSTDKKDEAMTEEERAIADAEAKADAEWLSEAVTKLMLEKKIANLDSNINDKKLTAMNNKTLSSVDKLYADWITDSARKEGETSYFAYESESDKDELVDGYYVVVFEGRKDNNEQMVNIRHILFKFEGGKTENGVTTYTDEQKQKAHDEAKAAYDEWLAGAATEESFAELAKTKSDDSSASNGGMIENIYPGQTVTNFNDWIFAEGRAAGDHGLVETEYGYHIVYFSSYDELTYREYCIDANLRSTAVTEWYQNITKGVKAVKGDMKYINTSMVFVSGN